MTSPDRPNSDADIDEIAKWMEEDFDWAVTEGIQNAREEDDKENGG
ncbi:hypothetical protein [Natrialba chahannaoensis]|nr:hypothetical protein [Natrialba chahannaoensis]